MARSISQITRKIEALYEKYPIMEKLNNDRVVSVIASNKTEGKVTVIENYDCYYGTEVDKEQVEQIGKFFTELSKYMK